nr:hypothetical protein [Candidatus Sigynarchaeota archaeon]
MNDARQLVLEDIVRDCAECNLVKYCFYRDDGTALSSTLTADNTEKMGRFVKFYSREMLINNYFVQEAGNHHMILYRLSRAVFILVITTDETQSITGTLMRVFTKYSDRLDQAFHDVPGSFKDIIRYILVSQALDMGPEPVAAHPSDMPQDMLMKISMKSMLMLTSERQGAIRGIPATIPFIEYHAMGVIFLFDVPHQDARGGAYDSCISILVDESYRPVIYEHMFAIENACIEAADLIRAKKDFKPVIDLILDRCSSIILKKGETSRGAELEGLMKDQMKRISKDLK